MDAPATPSALQLPAVYEPLPFDHEHSAWNVPPGTRMAAVNDLHIGISHREEHGGGEESAYTDRNVLDALKALTHEVDYLVLPGDIFEMVYHRYEDREEARNVYIRQMKELIAEAREHGCHIALVGGNHDDGGKFIGRLQELEDDPRYHMHFSYHPVALRIGEVFVTHGDLALRSGMEGITVEERVPSRERHVVDSFTKLLYGANRVHDLDHEPPLKRFLRKAEARLNASFVQAIIQKKEDMELPHHVAAARIWEVLVEANRTHPELLDELLKEDGSIVPAVKRVLSGHTHIPYTGVMLDYKDMAKFEGQYCDVDFDNPGTMLLGEASGRFNPLLYTFGEQGRVAKVENLQIVFPEQGGVEISIRQRASGWER